MAIRDITIPNAASLLKLERRTIRRPKVLMKIFTSSSDGRLQNSEESIETVPITTQRVFLSNLYSSYHTKIVKYIERPLRPAEIIVVQLIFLEILLVKSSHEQKTWMNRLEVM